MKTWNNKNPANDSTLQNDWNQTLITVFNEIVRENIIEKPIKIYASYKFKSLFKSMILIDKIYDVEYRYDNSNTIFINEVELVVENFNYNHQENEEWIESQKNVFLNLDSNKFKSLYPKMFSSKDKLLTDLSNKYSSGRKIEENDIVYTGILSDFINSVNTLIYFHIDELKSKDSIYQYSSYNGINNTIHPNLEYKTAWNVSISNNFKFDELIKKIKTVKVTIQHESPSLFDKMCVKIPLKYEKMFIGVELEECDIVTYDDNFNNQQDIFYIFNKNLLKIIGLIQSNHKLCSKIVITPYYDDMIEIKFNGVEPYIINNFKFQTDEVIISHPLTFRKYKKITFALPILVDLPVGEDKNVNINFIRDSICHRLADDFYDFLKNKESEK
jgi:hypothetical protein